MVTVLSSLWGNSWNNGHDAIVTQCCTFNKTLSVAGVTHTRILFKMWVTFCVLKEFDQLQGCPIVGKDGWHTGNKLRHAHENPYMHFLSCRQYCASKESALHGSSFLLDSLITTSYGILGTDLHRNHIYPSIFKAEHKTLSSTGAGSGHWAVGSGAATAGSRVQGLAKLLSQMKGNSTNNQFFKVTNFC